MNQTTRLPEQPFRKQEPPLPIPEGNLFRRLVTARALALFRKTNTHEVALSLWPSDKTLATIISLKAASAPAMTTVAGWAQELSQRLVADTAEALGAASGAVEVMQQGLVLSWDGYGIISVPAFVASANAGSFVGEGQPIPVRQFVTTAQPILPYKVASISALTREMMESSNAESLIGDVLIRSAGLAIDAVFFDANAAVAGVRPAGIRNGIAAQVASNNADAFGAFFEDMATLLNVVGQVGNKGPFILAGNAGRIIGASARFLGDDDTLISVMSASIGSDIIAIAPQAIAAALSTDPELELSNAGTLVMDTVPGAAGTSTERGLFQTETFALKVRWPVSWTVRDSRGVAWTTPTWK